MLVDVVVHQVSAQNALRQGIRVQVRSLLYHHQLVQNLRVSADPAQAHPRGDDLRERPKKHGMVLRIVMQRGKRFTPETQLSVRVIFDHEGPGGAQQFRHLPPGFPRVADAGGILEVGNRVHEPDAISRQGGLKLVRIDAIVEQGNGQEFRLVDAECLDCPQIAGTLQNHPVSRIDEHFPQQVQPLLRAGGYEYLVR